MFRSSSKIYSGLYWELREKRCGLPHELQTKFKIVNVDVEIDVDALADFHLTVRSAQGNNVAESIECAFETHFRADCESVKIHTEHFAESDYRTIIFPFFRQFVFDTTSRMSIPPIVVPLSGTMESQRAKKPSEGFLCYRSLSPKS